MEYLIRRLSEKKLDGAQKFLMWKIFPSRDRETFDGVKAKFFWLVIIHIHRINEVEKEGRERDQNFGWMKFYSWKSTEKSIRWESMRVLWAPPKVSGKKFTSNNLFRHKFTCICFIHYSSRFMAVLKLNVHKNTKVTHKISCQSFFSPSVFRIEFIMKTWKRKMFLNGNRWKNKKNELLMFFSVYRCLATKAQCKCKSINNCLFITDSIVDSPVILDSLNCMSQLKCLTSKVD